MLKSILGTAVLGLFALAAQAQDMAPVDIDTLIDPVIDSHILPGFADLAADALELDSAAQDSCDPKDPALRAAFDAAFDAWIRVSHLRFGPTETGDRAFALAFWPDTRGATPKALARLIADADPVVKDAADFATVSIAARGFYALEYLLYDRAFADMGDAKYRCALIRAITGDIARIAGAILTDWREDYVDVLRLNPPGDVYRDEKDVAQALFKALTTGLQFTSDTRLGRPLGTFDRPRPNRAEARRSGRSLAHVIASLQGTRELAMILSGDDPDLAAAYDRALGVAADLDDPVFAGVADPSGRLRVEILQQSIDAIRDLLRNDLGPRLGVSAGFNALDGD